MQIKIQRLLPEQWELFRQVRLHALGDSPDAFCSTLEKEEAYLEKDWKARLANENCRTFLALIGDSKPAGLVAGAPYDSQAGLFGMWVDSDERQKGIGSSLIDAVADWAKHSGYSQLLLDVADDNLSAISLYRSKGFIKTGVTGTVPFPRQHISEHQLCLRLT